MRYTGGVPDYNSRAPPGESSGVTDGNWEDNALGFIHAKGDLNPDTFECVLCVYESVDCMFDQLT